MPLSDHSLCGVHSKGKYPLTLALNPDGYEHAKKTKKSSEMDMSWTQVDHDAQLMNTLLTRNAQDVSTRRTDVHIMDMFHRRVRKEWTG